MENCFLTTVLNIRKAIFTVILVAFGFAAQAQVTTSSISGTVKDKKNGETLIGASVIATHVPSGTRYASITNEDGRYFMPAVRVGGPYKVVVTFVGYKESTQENIYSALGTAANVNFTVSEDAAVMDEFVVTGDKNDVFSNNRTGAASTVNSAQLAVLPTVGARSINDFTKYNPQGNGRSFGGQDARLNNVTIDGSVFNNGFGLGNSAIAGGRTGTTAISLDAIEEIQINLAPFDVRQSGFVGAGVNAVTRSGTNDYQGSAYTSLRNQDYIGTKAKNLPVLINKFNENIYGFRLGGPILKNKLFFFVNAEIQRQSVPGTTQVANGETGGTPTRVLPADLSEVSSILKSKYGYETGPYSGFNFLTESNKYLARFDYNINDQHKLSVRYSHHDSKSDQQISGSNALGNGNRTNQSDGASMAYQNSGYFIKDNTRSIVAELNSTFGSKMSNTIIASYNNQNEDREYKTPGLFPTFDILNNGTTYISAGMDPFTPSNKLNYTTMQFTDNFRYYMGNHTLTLGLSYEKFRSENLFYPGNNGVYVFNSLSDFRDAMATPEASLLKVPVKFQYRYSLIPGNLDPLQIIEANTTSLYVQDEFQVTPRLNITGGLRVGIIGFGGPAPLTNTYFADSSVTFINEKGATVKANTGLLPGSQTLFEPRLGFNFDVSGNKSTQIRGGVGIFTGRPPFVWVSNQVGNNGVLTGLIDVGLAANQGVLDNKGTLRNPLVSDLSVFRPSTADAYTPTSTGSYDIAITDAGYKFPQVFKANLAIDQKLPQGFVLTLEGIFGKNLNAVRYFDYNLRPANDTFKFAGPDQRPRFNASGKPAAAVNPAIRLNNNTSRNSVLASTDEGFNYTATVKLEKKLTKNWGGMIAYTYSQTKDLMSAGSIASSSFTAIRQVNGANATLPLTYSDFDIPHRIIAYASYRLSLGKGTFGDDLTFSLGFESRQSSRYSYVVGGDLNGDGITNNDLLYVPTSDDLSSGKFQFVNTTSRVGTTNFTYTPAQQAAAFDAYIKQDEYLNARRGQYTERNGGLLPWLTSVDFSASNNFNFKVGEKMHTLQLRLDILNVGNFINKNWGVGQRLVGGTPIAFAGVVDNTNGGLSASNTPTYRLNTQTVSNPDGSSSTFLVRDTYVNNNTLNDVYSFQLGLRYIFN
jgi:Carboxypeptidase regulatory-like domain